jgi:hypothetical protein
MVVTVIVVVVDLCISQRCEIIGKELDIRYRSRYDGCCCKNHWWRRTGTCLRRLVSSFITRHHGVHTDVVVTVTTGIEI